MSSVSDIIEERLRRHLQEKFVLDNDKSYKEIMRNAADKGKSLEDKALVGKFLVLFFRSDNRYELSVRIRDKNEWVEIKRNSSTEKIDMRKKFDAARTKLGRG